MPPVIVICPQVSQSVSQRSRKSSGQPVHKGRMAISLLSHSETATLQARAVKCSSDDHLDCWLEASQQTQQLSCWRRSLSVLQRSISHFHRSVKQCRIHFCLDTALFLIDFQQVNAEWLFCFRSRYDFRCLNK